MHTAQALGLWLACGLAAGLAQTGEADSDDATSAEQMRLFALTTPLRAAVATGNTERVAELLDAHRDWVASRDFEGNTLLHRAAAAGHRPLIELLLARGAHPGAHNAKYELALEVAEDNGHNALARQLREILATRHQWELDRRLSVLVLPFQNRSENREHAHWSHALDRLLSGAFARCARLLVRGDSTLRLGMRTSGLEIGQAVSLEQAVQVGRRVQIRCVVWGSFGPTNGGWQVTARMANVARGLEYQVATVTATNWYDIRDALVDKMLAALEVFPSEEEHRRLRERGTASSSAFEALSRARALQFAGGPLSEIESLLRPARHADPESAAVRLFLATVLANQGQMVESETLTREALQRDPELGTAHLLLGFILSATGREEEAGAAWRTALRLDPEQTEGLYRWGLLQAGRGRRQAAIHYYAAAVRIDPTSAALRATLAKALIGIGEHDRAHAELALAEQLAPDDPPPTSPSPRLTTCSTTSRRR